jgi:hypothetical protein
LIGVGIVLCLIGGLLLIDPIGRRS